MKLSSCLVMMVLCAACGGGGGGGGSPSEPTPVYPSIVGQWSGTWLLPSVSIPLSASAEFTQNGAGVGGTLSVLGFVIPIVGTLETNGHFGWIATRGCEKIVGQMTVAGSSMSGTANLDDSGCPSNAFRAGVMTLDRGVRSAPIGGQGVGHGDTLLSRMGSES